MLVEPVDHLVDRPSARRAVDGAQFVDGLQSHCTSLALAIIEMSSGSSVGSA
jgi:hypothetical protein